ncbi:hypothetical protein, partial [Nitratidesulfovibrio liaohensis]|uniref:hypothetical protein n=1 Tax=Nitratidesulfovibrio liaohensis TaxID=2604158 RepID=UPI001FBA18A4
MGATAAAVMAMAAMVMPCLANGACLMGLVSLMGLATSVRAGVAGRRQRARHHAGPACRFGRAA